MGPNAKNLDPCSILICIRRSQFSGQYLTILLDLRDDLHRAEPESIYANETFKHHSTALVRNFFD